MLGQVLEWAATLSITAVILMLAVMFCFAVIQIIRESWRK